MLLVKKNEKDGTCNTYKRYHTDITCWIEESDRKGLGGRVVVYDRI